MSLIKNNAMNHHAAHSNQHEISTAALIFASALVSLALILGAATIGKIKKVQHNNIEHILTLTVDKTLQSLTFWKNQKTANLQRLANHPQFQHLAQIQIAHYNHGHNLHNPTLQALRDFINQQKLLLGNFGFFIIALDGTSIASMRDSNIGSKNLIFKHLTQQFDRAVQGTPQFIAPIPSDIPLAQQRNIKDQKVPPSAFFVAPIINSKGDTIALLSERIAPGKQYSQLHDINSAAISVFSINRHGYLLSNPQNIDDYYSLGIIKKDEQAILSLKVSPFHKKPSLTQNNASESLTPIANAMLENNQKITLYSTVSYINHLNKAVYAVAKWSDDLGIGIIAEEEKSTALKSYYWLRNLIIFVISTLCLFVITITSVWIKSHNKILFSLKKSHSTLENLVIARTQELATSTEQTQKALEQLKARNYIIDQHAIVSMTDANGVITHANAAFSKISGYCIDELIGKNHRVVSSGQHTQIFWQSLFNDVAKKGIWKGEICNKHKAGHFYWVDTTITALKDKSNRIIEYISIRSDITQLHRIQQALINSKHRLELATRVSKIGIWQLNTNNGELKWDEQMHTLYGLCKNDFLGTLTCWKNTIHPDDLKIITKKLEQTINTHKTLDTEFRIINNHGDVRYIKVFAEYENPKKNASIIIGVNYDITELKTLKHTHNI
ncbi:PAS domain-containing protein [Marinagarivorans algicola]|uniref:PAS domain-containing protein n=1 Tax=Marinagarivorans algicola TaxID=1513270 RepID=UPI0006B93C52|nr:PAS domain-containing protein [Marinagarivorans algicola]